MDKLRRQPRKIDRSIVYTDKLRSAVSYRLADLLGNVCLLFFRFAADQKNRFSRSNLSVRVEWNAEIIKKGRKIVAVRQGEIV